jgi:type IV pilus assembly protein PilX
MKLQATPNQYHQQGATLIVSLAMLLVVLMLSTSLAGMALMGEKAARNERDKHIAMHAAEAALADAEKDIENSTAKASRSALFSPYSTEGFTEGCGKGDGNKYQGLCINHGSQHKAAWLDVALTNSDTNSASVQFGRFTGQTMPSGVGPFPAQLPRYIIELMLDTTPGLSASPLYFYRITAVGFGADSSTQIVLQSFYRKTGI